MKRILLSLIFCATPTLHAASLLDDAKAIEKKMDETTPAISHSMSNKVESVTPEMGQKIMDVSDMVGDLTTAAVDTKGKIDDETFEAICHVIARNGLYDQMGESVDTRFTKKFRARLDKVFTKFQNERKPYEKGRPFDEKRMEQIRVQLDMAVSAQQEGAKKKRSEGKQNDDGAALSPCDTGLDCPALAIRTLTGPAAKLTRLPRTVTGGSTASRN